MSGVTLAAAASIAVGLSLGAVATVGVTLASEASQAHESHGVAPARAPAPSGPVLVQYGDRCLSAPCPPCGGTQGCLKP